MGAAAQSGEITHTRRRADHPNLCASSDRPCMLWGSSALCLHAFSSRPPAKESRKHPRCLFKALSPPAEAVRDPGAIPKGPGSIRDAFSKRFRRAPPGLPFHAQLLWHSSVARSPPIGGTSLFPAKREAKREATKAWQAWPGNQTSSRCLVRSLVSAAGGYGGPGFEIRVPLETKWCPKGMPSGPILPFLEVLGPDREEQIAWAPRGVARPHRAW